MHNHQSAGTSLRGQLHGRPLGATASILCVDDERNVQASLRRLFQARGYRVLTAESGHAGLRVLENEPIDLVISDMRMPEMNGAQFLRQVCERWPDTMRLLLTGYSDTQSILDAINHGEIYRYITKPWDDHDIVLMVQQSLERQALLADKRRLEALTGRQNDELKTLNASLERKVDERTTELQAANIQLTTAVHALKDTNAQLEHNFLTSIKVFTNLIDMRGGRFAGRARRVADLAHRIAVRMGFDEHDAQEVYVAGLLHDIGKIGLPDALLSKPMQQMTDEELGLYQKHPAIGQHALMPLQGLRNVAVMIRGQHEQYDGGGFPDRLPGVQIPLGARILAVAGDYDHLQAGVVVTYQLSPDAARANILNGSGKLYDPRVVEAFVAMLDGTGSEAHDMLVEAAELRPGMTLSRDLINRDGMLLLSAGHEINMRLIGQIAGFDRAEDGRLAIYVHRAS
jgi:response regulator RpfG family c-di-GMP phosphodiesterase